MHCVSRNVVERWRTMLGREVETSHLRDRTTSRQLEVAERLAGRTIVGICCVFWTVLG